MDSHADAYALFASLNNQDVPLSAVNLIKNALLAKVADADENELDYYFDQWQEMLRNLGDDYTTQERFFRQNYDALQKGGQQAIRSRGWGATAARFCGNAFQLAQDLREADWTRKWCIECSG